MKRQLTSILLFSALLVGGASTFVSCTDHESDSAYNTSISLADAIAKQKAELTDLNNELAKKVDQTTDALEKQALSDRIQENKDAIAALGDKFGDYASLDAAIAASKAYTDDKVTEAKDVLNQKIEQLRGDDEAAREQLKEALMAKITANGVAISTETAARQQLQDNYDMAFDFLINKNLNSIAINATENPVLGYFNAAFVGSQLNLASSFYGTAAQNNQDWDIAKDDFLNDGNAGEIYVSLNPTEIDPRCITSLKLVDSQGNEAKGFELGQLQNTSRVLTYGFTKAASVSSNGFYAIPVKAVDPANDDFSLNKGELKEAAKNVIAKLQNPKESSLNLSQIATALYSSVNNQLKAYTVKAEYYLWNPETMELVKKSAVAPAYNMAAFAVNPLSFNTLKDNQSLKNLGLALDKYMLPTLSDKIGKYTDALDFQIKYEGNKQIEVASLLATKNLRCWENPEKKEVYICDKNGNVLRTVSNASLETYVINNNQNYNGDDWYYNQYDIEWKYIENGWFDGNTWYHNSYINWDFADDEVLYVIKTTDNTIEKLLSSLNEQISTELSPIKDAIQNAANKWDTAIQPVNNLLHKINAHISDVNQLLQPTMLYKSSKTGDWNTLSTLGGRLGTRMTGTGSTVLVATSWTGELLAPAYKKTVEVKGNPAGAKVTLMDGTTPAKKIAGSTQKVLFTATAKGDYTIVYKAVDYSGVSVEKEYHITVE